jgi:hypothetical protein
VAIPIYQPKLPPPDPPFEIERLRFQAANAILRLWELAKTDKAALEVLATELQFHVRAMNADILANPEYDCQFTRKCATWPASVSVDREIQNRQIWLASAMQPGADAPLNYSGRQWSRRTPEIRAALYLIDCL